MLNEEVANNSHAVSVISVTPTDSFWCAAGSGWWQHGSASIARLVSSFRQCWPQHLALATADVIRPWGCSDWLVYIISARTHAKGSLLFIQLRTISVALRRATRIGPGADSVLTVYRRSFAATSASSGNTSQLCRQYADLWVLSSLWSTNSPTACQQASMRPLFGYEQIGCNSTTPRLRCCGAHHNGVSICCQLLSFVLANCQFCQSDQFATSALISMLTWVCGRTSCQPSELASPLSTRFVASDVHCQYMPCSHW